MNKEQGSRVGELLLTLIKEQLPPGISGELTLRYHSYFSRFLSSQLIPEYAQDERDTVNKMHELLDKSNSRDKTASASKMQEYIKTLSTKNRTLTRRWAILRTIFVIARDSGNQGPVGAPLFTVRNSQRYKAPSAKMVEELPKDLRVERALTREQLIEKEIIRELMFLFHGVGSNSFIYSQKEQSFMIDPNLELSLSKRKIILCLCEIGWLFAKIQEFLRLQENTIKGLIFQSLCFAVKEEINEYYHLMAILENMRDTGSQGLNLKKLFLWTLEPYERLKWIAVLTETCEGLKGGELLSALYSYSSNGNLQLQDLASRILTKTLAPFMNFLEMWVYAGELVDPMGEFFIEQADEQLPEDQFWEKKYRVRTSMIPIFVTEELAQTILVAGKTKTFMRKFCGESQWRLSEKFIEVQNLISFRYMEGSRFKAFENWAKNVKIEADQALKKLIIDKFRFMDHFAMVKKYLMLGQGDFMNTLMELLQDELSQSSSRIFKHSLLSILETAKSTSCAQFQDPALVSLVSVKIFDPEPGSVGWDIFSLNYEVGSPLTTIFTNKIMGKYLVLFNFFWKVKRLEHILNDIWMLHKKNTQIGVSDDMIESLNTCNLIRHQMLHFVKTFFVYLMLEVVETEWLDFMKGIETAGSLDEIISLHERFVGNVMKRAITSEEKAPLKSQLLKILEAVARFKNTQDVIFVNLKDQQARALEREKILDTELLSDEEEDYSIERADIQQMREHYTILFAQTNALIGEIWRGFKDTFDIFLQLLEKDEQMKSLALKLDFNEYYKYNRSTQRNRMNFDGFMENGRMDIEGGQRPY